jgi:hypothetical protein
MPYLFALLGVHDRGGPLDEMDSAVRRRRTRDAIRSKSKICAAPLL